MNIESTVFFLSLGTNSGDKTANIAKALDFLSGIGNILKISSLYETEPVGMESGAEDFYNLVLSLRLPSSLSPHDLLGKIKEFESSLGRDILHSHNRPRVMDIDILLVEDRVIRTGDLVVPHKEMTRRAFVLIPLAEIAPGVVHPVLKKSVKEILVQLPGEYKALRVKRIGPFRK